jgi:hypothetical protein
MGIVKSETMGLFLPHISHCRGGVISVFAFVGLCMDQGKDVVFRFIIEYSSLRDFYRPQGNNRSIFIWGFLQDDIFASVETWD